jgi:hypothetical protein
MFIDTNRLQAAHLPLHARTMRMLAGLPVSDRKTDLLAKIVDNFSHVVS